MLLTLTTGSRLPTNCMPHNGREQKSNFRLQNKGLSLFPEVRMRQLKSASVVQIYREESRNQEEVEEHTHTHTPLANVPQHRDYQPSHAREENAIRGCCVESLG